MTAPTSAPAWWRTEPEVNLIPTHDYVVGPVVGCALCGRVADQWRGAFTALHTEKTCGCGHVTADHGADGCVGTGADLDPEYGIPADEACACTSFDPED